MLWRFIDKAIEDVKLMLDEALDNEERNKFKALSNILNILNLIRRELL